jgi:phenylpyruvate tautomerase PptA (4-oxalocrotonate tautomerase family)
MPVCLIESPCGLNEKSKKELIETVLTIMVNTYKMVADRVYIKEYDLVNAGYTPRTMENGNWSIQKEKARVVCSIIAPPGLDKDSKRKMFRDITTIVAHSYQIEDQRDILAFLNEHPLDNVASNGYIQTESPAFVSPATA